MRRATVSILATAGCVAFANVMLFVIGTSKMIYFIPMMICIPALAFYSRKPKKYDFTMEALMNEAPSAIGMLSATIGQGGSLDAAVRDIAANGPRFMSSLFRKVVNDADCRRHPDMRAGLIDMLTDLPEKAASLRRAVHILITASESSDENERHRMIRDAEGMTLSGLKQMGETYSSALNMPCTMIFGLGVMVPMMLISILPMLSIGGQFGSAVLDIDTVSFVTLIVIPAVVALIIISLRDKNPFQTKEDRAWSRHLLPFMVAVPLIVFITRRTGDLFSALIVGFSASGVLAFAAMYPSMKAKVAKMKKEAILGDLLFETGNRLISGETFEDAVVGSLRSRGKMASVADALEKEYVLCRGDAESATYAVLSPFSEKLAKYYCDILRTSYRDSGEAGRLAVNLAYQIQDQNRIRKGIENKLRSMMDMMSGTSAVFAPLILGMSIVMLGPLSEIAEFEGIASVSLVLTIYLVELAALISVLSSQLMGRGGMIEAVYRFSILMPVSLLIFYVCTLFAI